MGGSRPPTTKAQGGRGLGGWTREGRALGQAEALGHATRLATARAESRGSGHGFNVFFFFFSSFCVNFRVLEKMK